MTARIRVGIGGWTFAPWRGRFYPDGLPQTQELHFASRQVTAIEINGTFYRTQTADSFARWAAETPDDFIFAVKAARAASYATDPEKAAASVERFLHSGLTQLGSKLGPILWQLPLGRKFNPAAMEAFLQRLPATLDGLRLRHVIEAGHPSFADPVWIALLRQYGAARALVERADEPAGDVTADFVYLRLERNDAKAPSGYAEAGLAAWAKRVRAWAEGQPAADLKRLSEPTVEASRPKDCFVFFIAGDKERAPDAARAMLARLAA
jgi:uncharacterized protein YecE (DUF72 family)